MMLIMSIIAMVLALICYSVGVWGEKISGKLTKFNLSFFWIKGLIWNILLLDLTSISYFALMNSFILFDTKSIFFDFFTEYLSKKR